ncbi:MAG: AsmA family protein [Gemmatimonadota bacterium]
MKKVLVVLGVLVGLVVVGVVALLLLVDVNAYKPRIEAAATDALGMELRIGGKASLRLVPSLGISVADVHVRNRGTELAKVGSLRIGVKLIPLLSREIQVTEFVLDKPDVLIEKGKDGKFNFETPPRAPRPAPSAAKETAALFVRDSAVRGGRLLYLDRTSGRRMEIDGVDLTVRDLSLGGKPGESGVKALSFTGDLRVADLKDGNVSASEIRAAVKAAGGVFRVRPLAMRMFGGSGDGEVDVDLSGPATAVKVRYALSGFRAAEALAAVSKKATLSGPLSLTADLSLRGRNADAMLRSLGGTISLRGEDLAVKGMDVDETLEKVSQTQKVGIADVGAFLLAGPLGTLATKGFDVGGVYMSTLGGETRITRLVSDWSVSGGVAEARDVAFATRKNRIALKGKLDIADSRFVGVTVAALDAKGCATLRQGISGPFRHPKLDKVSTLQSAAAPILGLFAETKKLLTLGECEPFYTGTVAHPE